MRGSGDAASLPRVGQQSVGTGLRTLLGKEAIAGQGWLVSAGNTERRLRKGADQPAAFPTARRRRPGGHLAMVGSGGGSCWGSASVRTAHASGPAVSERKAGPPSHSFPSDSVRFV